MGVGATDGGLPVRLRRLRMTRLKTECHFVAMDFIHVSIRRGRQTRVAGTLSGAVKEFMAKTADFITGYILRLIASFFLNPEQTIVKNEDYTKMIFKPRADFVTLMRRLGLFHCAWTDWC